MKFVLIQILYWEFNRRAILRKLEQQCLSIFNKTKLYKKGKPMYLFYGIKISLKDVFRLRIEQDI